MLLAAGWTKLRLDCRKQRADGSAVKPTQHAAHGVWRSMCSKAVGIFERTTVFEGSRGPHNARTKQVHFADQPTSKPVCTSLFACLSVLF